MTTGTTNETQKSKCNITQKLDYSFQTSWAKWIQIGFKMWSSLLFAWGHNLIKVCNCTDSVYTCTQREKKARRHTHFVTIYQIQPSERQSGSRPAFRVNSNVTSSSRTSRLTGTPTCLFEFIFVSVYVYVMTSLWIQNVTYYNVEFTTLKRVHFIMDESRVLQRARRLNLRTQSWFILNRKTNMYWISLVLSMFDLNVELRKYECQGHRIRRLH